jgi:hypothetical protein
MGPITPPLGGTGGRSAGARELAPVLGSCDGPEPIGGSDPKQDSFKDAKSCNTSPFFKIEARLLGEGVRFFAQVATGTRCAQPTMVMRTQICRRDLPRESWTTMQVRLNPAHDASGHVDI